MVNKAVRKVFSRMGFGYTFVGIISYGIQILLLFVLGVIFALNGSSNRIMRLFDDNNAVIVLTMACMYVIALPVCYLLFFRRVEAFPPAKATLGVGRALKYFVIATFCMVGGALVGNAFSAFLGSAGGGELSNETIDLIGELNPAMMILSSVIIGPFMEELMFRKILIDRLRIFGEKPVMILSGLMFGLFHTNFFQFFYAFWLGILLAYIYLRTGKLRYTYTYHLLVNLLFGAVPIFFMNDNFLERLEAISAGDLSQMSLSVAGLIFLELFEYVCAFVGFFLVVFSFKRMVFRPQQYEIPKRLTFKTIYLSRGMILYFFFFLAVTIFEILAQLDLLSLPF